MTFFSTLWSFLKKIREINVIFPKKPHFTAIFRENCHFFLKFSKTWDDFSQTEQILSKNWAKFFRNWAKKSRNWEIQDLWYLTQMIKRQKSLLYVSLLWVQFPSNFHNMFILESSKKILQDFQIFANFSVVSSLQCFH